MIIFYTIQPSLWKKNLQINDDHGLDLFSIEID